MSAVDKIRDVAFGRRAMTMQLMRELTAEIEEKDRQIAAMTATLVTRAPFVRTSWTSSQPEVAKR